MQIYLSPRSRPVNYYPVGSSAASLGIESLVKTDIKSRFKSLIGTDRLIQANLPITTKLRPGKLANTVYPLPTVQSFGWTWAREVTEEYGLQAYMLLPWYTKAVTAVVKGKAYLGAFTSVTDIGAAALSSLIGQGGTYITDFFHNEMGELDKRLSGVNLLSRRDVNSIPQPATSAVSNYTDTAALISRLDIGVPGDPGGLSLIGFVSNFQVEETVTAPYVHNYTLTYLGVDFSWYVDAQTRAMRLYDSAQQNSSIKGMR